MSEQYEQTFYEKKLEEQSQRDFLLTRAESSPKRDFSSEIDALEKKLSHALKTSYRRAEIASRYASGICSSRQHYLLLDVEESKEEAKAIARHSVIFADALMAELDK